MKNFIYLYHSTQTTPPTKEGLEAFTAWYESLGDNVVDGGSPINRASQAIIANGVSKPSNETVIGYAIVKANSLDEAVEMAMSNPLANADGASVHVYETAQM